MVETKEQIESSLKELDEDVQSFIEVDTEQKKKVSKDKYEKHCNEIDECFLYFIQKSQDKDQKLYSFEMSQPVNCVSAKQKFFDLYFGIHK